MKSTPGILLLVLILAPVAACAQVTAGTLGNVMKRRAEQAEQDREREQAARRQPVIKELKDDKALAYVGEVVARIVRQTDLKNQDKIVHQVLEWDIVNAFVTPDMKVYVTTGLLELVESDDELACVLGHEIGHLTAKHIHGRAKQAMLWQGLMGLAMAFSRSRNGVMASQLLGTMGMMRYGRGQEMEADRVGLEFARKAGYDPRGMVNFLKKMGEKDGKMDDPLSVWLSSHPPGPQRIEQARKIVKSEGLLESRVLKLSFNIKTDRSPVDFSKGIEGSLPTTGAALPATNLLANGALQGQSDSVAGWTSEPVGALTTLKKDGISLSGAMGGPGWLRAEPVAIDPAQAYLLRVRYRALVEVELALTAQFLDGAGAPAGEVFSLARAKKGEEGRLGLDIGGAGKPIPPAARKVVFALSVPAGEKVTAELTDARLELASTPVAATAASVHGNLVANPGFETADARGKLPEGWTIAKGAGELDEASKAGGKRSLKLTAANKKEWAAFRSDRMPVAAGEDYLLSGQLRSAKGNQRMSLGLEFYRADGTAISTVLVAAQGVFPPAEFTKYHGILFASGGRVNVPPFSVSCAVVGMSGYYSTEPCWFDDIAFIRVQSGQGQRKVALQSGARR